MAKYRLRCTTEGIDKYVTSEAEPTVCPDDAGHTIDVASITVVDSGDHTAAISEDDKKIINFGVDGIYSSTATNPSFAVLGFRGHVGALADYFTVGSKIMGKVFAVTDIDAGKVGRFRLVNETDGGAMVGVHNLDVNTIAWQSGNTIRYTFNATPDLTKIKVGDTMRSELATNASNNGEFIITAIDDVSDWIEVTNPGRSDATDDEAADSPAVVEGGAIMQFTTSTLTLNKSEAFEVPQNSEFRIQLNRNESAGAPVARISSLQLIIWPE